MSKQLTQLENTGLKATKQQVNARILHIVDMLLSLENHNNITHTLTQQWNMSESSIRNYITRAKAMILDRPLESTQALINQHIAIREDIYRNSEHSRDKLQAVESIAKLQGLDIKRIEVINNSKYDTIEDSTILEALIDDDSE